MHGPKQVNNEMVSRTRNNVDLQNKLLEAQDGERLDEGTAKVAISGDTAMATVGKVDRAEK